MQLHSHFTSTMAITFQSNVLSDMRHTRPPLQAASKVSGYPIGNNPTPTSRIDLKDAGDDREESGGQSVKVSMRLRESGFSRQPVTQIGLVGEKEQAAHIMSIPRGG